MLPLTEYINFPRVSSTLSLPVPKFNRPAVQQPDREAMIFEDKECRRKISKIINS